MIFTLAVTLLIEGVVGAGYCLRRGKPPLPVLLTGVLANLLTQSLLWAALIVFFRHYRPVLYFAEFVIWALEGFMLRGVPANRLEWKEAFALSFFMNLASFGAGWFLPL